jgi:hypothetical protein
MNQRSCQVFHYSLLLVFFVVEKHRVAPANGRMEKWLAFPVSLSIFNAPSISEVDNKLAKIQDGNSIANDNELESKNGGKI